MAQSQQFTKTTNLAGTSFPSAHSRNATSWRSWQVSLVALCLAGLIHSCTPPAPEGINKLKEEMHDRKLKRVTAGAVQENAQNFGTTLADTIDNKFTAEAARLEANESCKNLFDRIATKQATNLQAKVLRLPFGKTDTTLLDPKLKDLYEAYQYSYQQGQILESNVQKLSDTAFWVSKAISINAQTCLRCHTSGPDAKPLKLGSTIGIYAVRLTRQQVIRHIDIKTLKPK